MGVHINTGSAEETTYWPGVDLEAVPSPYWTTRAAPETAPGTSTSSGDWYWGSGLTPRKWRTGAMQCPVEIDEGELADPVRSVMGHPGVPRRGRVLAIRRGCASRRVGRRAVSRLPGVRLCAASRWTWRILALSSSPGRVGPMVVVSVVAHFGAFGPVAASIWPCRTWCWAPIRCYGPGGHPHLHSVGRRLRVCRTWSTARTTAPQRVHCAAP